jgi:hypothetical protein
MPAKLVQLLRVLNLGAHLLSLRHVLDTHTGSYMLRTRVGLNLSSLESKNQGFDSLGVRVLCFCTAKTAVW